MKQLVLFSFLFIAGDSLFAQPGKTGAKPATKKTPTHPKLLKTLTDSASYAVGLSIAGFCKEHGIAGPNVSLISKSFNDVKNDESGVMTETQANDIVNKLLAQGKIANKSVAGREDTLRTKWGATDSASYAIGFNHASFFKQQGIADLDTAFIVKAVKDVIGNKAAQFNDQAANKVMNKLIISIQEEKAKSVIEAGRTFLANNKKRPEVKVTASGLQYEVIRQGTGARPVKTDTFVCHYRGVLLDGTEFDASYNRNQPLVMAVSQVIRGWKEGLQLMPVGSKYKFYIPYELGYGPFDNPPIPGGSMLIFEVDLLNIKKAKAIKKTVKPR